MRFPSQRGEFFEICLFINTQKGILAGHFRDFEPKFLDFPFFKGGLGGKKTF
jgi:hypothetical protein